MSERKRTNVQMDEWMIFVMTIELENCLQQYYLLGAGAFSLLIATTTIIATTTTQSFSQKCCSQYQFHIHFVTFHLFTSCGGERKIEVAVMAIVNIYTPHLQFFFFFFLYSHNRFKVEIVLLIKFSFQFWDKETTLKEKNNVNNFNTRKSIRLEKF